MKQEMMGGSGISWTICKSFAPCSRETTMQVPHHSVFTGQMPFLPPNQQCQSIQCVQKTPYILCDETAQCQLNYGKS